MGSGSEWGGVGVVSGVGVEWGGGWEWGGGREWGDTTGEAEHNITRRRIQLNSDQTSHI